ncbi:MAG: acylphosphatase [Candidatus Pacearchaeota archaeon]|nr:acylphosphatase [Candidatus Pacearchaeota archaeon]
MKKASRIYIFGTVQGVFFRNFVKENAEKKKVKGYIRNKEDGSVEAWLEGDSKAVEEMIELCKKGPEHSVINRLDIVEESLQEMKEFKILSF